MKWNRIEFEIKMANEINSLINRSITNDPAKIVFLIPSKLAYFFRVHVSSETHTYFSAVHLSVTQSASASVSGFGKGGGETHKGYADVHDFFTIGQNIFQFFRSAIHKMNLIVWTKSKLHILRESGRERNRRTHIIDTIQSANVLCVFSLLSFALWVYIQL